MSAQMDDALQTLIVESRELLQHMEDALLEALRNAKLEGVFEVVAVGSDNKRAVLDQIERYYLNDRGFEKPHFVLFDFQARQDLKLPENWKLQLCDRAVGVDEYDVAEALGEIIVH